MATVLWRPMVFRGQEDIELGTRNSADKTSSVRQRRPQIQRPSTEVIRGTEAMAARSKTLFLFVATFTFTVFAVNANNTEVVQPPEGTAQTPEGAVIDGASFHAWNILANGTTSLGLFTIIVFFVAMIGF
ncbi:hypothetical protein QR680_009465 [Steinernema hermaphroditum]|uniref:Uncharacterized protein n=1 Tax=Steinernema hermaphroditum TaxID=289476 RepID=A0AA39ILN1_9BILA|nr:hypothetical protein QR680_009465 [Steinernema hermaphroditum]